MLALHVSANYSFAQLHVKVSEPKICFISTFILVSRLQKHWCHLVNIVKRLVRLNNSSLELENKDFEVHIIYLKAVNRILHNTRSCARESLLEQRATSAFKKSLILECEGLLVGANWIQLSVFLSVCLLASAKQGTR